MTYLCKSTNKFQYSPLGRSVDSVGVPMEGESVVKDLFAYLQCFTFKNNGLILNNFNLNLIKMSGYDFRKRKLWLFRIVF